MDANNKWNSMAIDELVEQALQSVDAEHGPALQQAIEQLAAHVGDEKQRERLATVALGVAASWSAYAARAGVELAAQACQDHDKPTAEDHC